MVSKRKRADLSDSGSDEVAPGKQILPVANLPHDFDQEPQDGTQYLFLVRRDARRLPHVTRVRNPYEVSETRVVDSCKPLTTNVLPCEEWRIAFQTHFSNLRKNLTQATIHFDHDNSTSRAIPEKKDRDAWWKFLAGFPESVWSPKGRSVRKKPGVPYHMRAFGHSAEAVVSDDAAKLATGLPTDTDWFGDMSESFWQEQSALDHCWSAELTNTASLTVGSSKGSDEDRSPPEVTPSHLREIDHRMSTHLLMYFTHWINVHLQDPGNPLTTVSVNHGQWIFALLTKVEDQVSADEMNLLRNLARACFGLIRLYRGEDVKSEGVSDATCMSGATCWMVYTAVAGYWGQRDLWADAEAMLAGV